MSAHTKSCLRATENEPRAYIRWINGRAYAELGGWAAWGGRRQEPLRDYGERFATENPNTAAILLGYRIRELRGKREADLQAAADAKPPVPTSIASFIGYHLACKAQVGGHRPSERELDLLRTRLIHAGKFFLGQGARDLRDLTRGNVAAYMEHLQGDRSSSGHPGRSVGYLSAATQRKYLMALNNMLKRAKSNGIIKTNFVADLIEQVE